MNKINAYLVVTTLLLAMLLLSACGTFSPNPRSSGQTAQATSMAIPGTGQTPAAASPVTVKDQAFDGTTVVIAKVVSQGPGWMTIHAQDKDTIGPVIGYEHVNPGENDNVAVKIEAQKATPVLYAMLHIDAGKVGVYEFPGADIPATLNGVMITPAFHITMKSP
jgi:hypothetical protein